MQNDVLNSEAERERNLWYKNGIVWLIIAIPVTSIIMGIVILTISIKNYDGLVVDDYYKRGKYINKIIAPVKPGNAIQLKVEIDNTRKAVVVETADAVQGNRLQLDFFHITKKQFDKRVMLERGSGNRFHGALPRLQHNAWYYMQVESPTWKVTRRVQLNDRKANTTLQFKAD